jgi:hypothetical protein
LRWLLIINPLFEFLTAFKKRQAFGRDVDFLSGFGVSAYITFILFDMKAAKSSYFDSFTFDKGL